MAKQSVTEPTPEVLPVSTLPAGVQMHEGGAFPQATQLPAVQVRDPRKPPPGWKGGYMSCSACGDFITTDRCPTCAPALDVSNIQTSGPPKMMAG